MSHPEADANGENHRVAPGESVVKRSAVNRLPSRALVITLGAILLAFVAGIVVLQVFVVERIPELTEARLEAAEKRWRRKPFRSYDLDVEIRGAQRSDAHVEVRHGVVTAATINGRAPDRRTWNVWTVPGQFETLERELEMAEDPQHEMGAAAGAQFRLRCEFDPQYGYPRRYHRHTFGGGPEVYWRVRRFTPK